MSDYVIDHDAADKVKRFAETFCTLSDGERAGQPVRFLDWVWRDVVFPLYAHKRPDGTRRYRRGSIWTCRKQTKTTTLAVLSLYQLLEEPGAQVYVVSSGIECASQLYKMAADMVDQSPALKKRLWVRPNIRVIEDKKHKSVLRVLSGDKKGKSGQGASCVFWDELAEIEDDEAWHRLYNSGMARRQPVWLAISTPQYARNALAWSQYQKAKAVIEGKDPDPEYLAVIKGVPDDVPYRLDDGGLNPEVFDYIPALGQTVTKEYIVSDWQACKDNPREVCRFVNHVLGRWTQSASEWLPPNKLDECTRPVDLESLKGKDCYIGLDGAVSRLGAYVLYFPSTKVALPRFFHPEATARDSDEKLNTSLIAWGEAGHLTLTDGDLSDWSTLETALKADLEAYNVLEIAFDPAGVEGRMTEFQSESYAPCIPIKPYPSHTAEPTRYLERLVMSGEITLPDNPVMRWCLLNAAVKEDQHDRIFIDREKSGGRYDGASALILALHRVLAAEVQDCVYNHRGVISF